MPQMTVIGLADRAATPVTHSFSPHNVEGGVATFVKTTGVPIGDKILQVNSRTTATGLRKVTVNLTLPTVATVTVNGIDNPSVVRVNRAALVLTFAPDSTLQERKDIVGMMEKALAASQATMDPVLTQLERLY